METSDVTATSSGGVGGPVEPLLTSALVSGASMTLGLASSHESHQQSIISTLVGSQGGISKRKTRSQSLKHDQQEMVEADGSGVANLVASVVPPASKRVHRDSTAVMKATASTSFKIMSGSKVTSLDMVDEEGALTSAVLEESRPSRAALNPSSFSAPSQAFTSQPSTRSRASSVEDRAQFRAPSMSPDPSTFTDRSEIVTAFVELDPLASRERYVAPLSATEVKELEFALEFPNDGDWQEDWIGMLAFSEKEIANPNRKAREKKQFKQSLLQWSKNGGHSLKLLYNLIRYVCHHKQTPSTARKILSHANPNSSFDIERCIRRVSYDPIVLQEDGWTTQKSKEPHGATGGPYRIGDMVRWEATNAVVIAYLHDPDIGDMWKALWIDNDDFASFDLEAEELLEAKKKWERRQKQPTAATTADPGRRSSRNVSSDFTIRGIEYGIVLCSSYSKGARPGVYWPARVMHASETSGSPSQGVKRSINKQRLEVVFLAPYWNSEEQAVNRSRRVESLSEAGDSAFSSGPLLLLESVDATSEMIKEYPYSKGEELDLSLLRMSFRFTGLPKSAFPRFVDSHRLAMSLLLYAKEHIQAASSVSDRAVAGLFETHPLAVQAPMFPSVVLHLPFSFMLSQLPRPSDDQSRDDSLKEPVIQIQQVVEAMKPPNCWGQHGNGHASVASPVQQEFHASHDLVTLLPSDARSEPNGTNWTSLVVGLAPDLTTLNRVLKLHATLPAVHSLLTCIAGILSTTHQAEEIWDRLPIPSRKEKLAEVMRDWIFMRSIGEEALSSIVTSEKKIILTEWKRAAERIFKSVMVRFSGLNFGNGFSVVITDHRCNQHLTSDGCLERPVRLPAAMKGAKLAVAQSKGSARIIPVVPEKYIEFVENNLLNKAHVSSYLRRMKSRCSDARTEQEVIMLTDDSNGNGGEDSRGSKGTWKAAVAGVAAAVAGVDMIFRGECLSAFAAARPPGHHAGRTLHSMNAVSNGFCILNSVACAAIYAATPASEGGLGLHRVCVIDFDVHHGNGTQDILCSTYDPRFLYISMHAGGSEVNGVSLKGDPKETDNLSRSNLGIFPGRCGDTSPHKGVLNLPLGPKMTPHAVGTALISKVSDAVNAFVPDLIILSAGFDAHKNDPMGLGGLSAEDFAHITDAACNLALKWCSGRILSVLEGGYGVPCCRPQRDIFLPGSVVSASKHEFAHDDVGSVVALGDSSDRAEGGTDEATKGTKSQPSEARPRPQPSKILELGDDLPATMDDQVSLSLQRRLEKCSSEGFVECVEKHVHALLRYNKLS